MTWAGAAAYATWRPVTPAVRHVHSISTWLRSALACRPPDAPAWQAAGRRLNQPPSPSASTCPKRLTLSGLDTASQIMATIPIRSQVPAIHGA